MKVPRFVRNYQHFHGNANAATLICPANRPPPSGPNKKYYTRSAIAPARGTEAPIGFTRRKISKLCEIESDRFAEGGRANGERRGDPCEFDRGSAVFAKTPMRVNPLVGSPRFMRVEGLCGPGGVGSAREPMNEDGSERKCEGSAGSRTAVDEERTISPNRSSRRSAGAEERFGEIAKRRVPAETKIRGTTRQNADHRPLRHDPIRPPRRGLDRILRRTRGRREKNRLKIRRNRYFSEGMDLSGNGGEPAGCPPFPETPAETPRPSPAGRPPGAGIDPRNVDGFTAWTRPAPSTHPNPFRTQCFIFS